MTQIPLFPKVGCSGTPRCCAGMQQTFRWELWDCHLVLVAPGAVHPILTPILTPTPGCLILPVSSPNTMQDRTASSPWAAPGRTPAENRDVCSILGGLARRGGPLCSLCPPLQLPAEGQGDEGGWGMKEVGSAASPPRVIKGESAARGWLLFIS